MRTSRHIKFGALALVAFIAALSISAPAHADDDDWGHHQRHYYDNARWEPEHREREEERERHAYYEQQYYRVQPRVIYARPTVAYAPAPVYYAQPEPFWGINLSFPLDMR